MWDDDDELFYSGDFSGKPYNLTDWCGINDEDGGGANYTSACPRSLYAKALEDAQEEAYCLDKYEFDDDEGTQRVRIWWYSLLLWSVAPNQPPPAPSPTPAYLPYHPRPHAPRAPRAGASPPPTSLLWIPRAYTHIHARKHAAQHDSAHAHPQPPPATARSQR